MEGRWVVFLSRFCPKLVHFCPLSSILDVFMRPAESVPVFLQWPKAEVRKVFLFLFIYMIYLLPIHPVTLYVGVDFSLPAFSCPPFFCRHFLSAYCAPRIWWTVVRDMPSFFPCYATRILRLKAGTGILWRGGISCKCSWGRYFRLLGWSQSASSSPASPSPRKGRVRALDLPYPIPSPQSPVPHPSSFILPPLSVR